MNILVTGAEGFVGKNLVENLKTIKQGKSLNMIFIPLQIYSMPFVQKLILCFTWLVSIVRKTAKSLSKATAIFPIHY